MRKDSDVDVGILCYDVFFPDYPDGLTFNLRKKTDFARNITEKTRGDVVLSLNRLDLVTTFDKMLQTYLKEDLPQDDEKGL